MVLEVIFWVLLILSIGSSFVPDSTPYVAKSRSAAGYILILILGLKVFGNFLTK